MFGFVVELDFAQPLSDDQKQALHRALRDEVLEPRGLSSFDQFTGHQWSFTVRSEASQATHADRKAIESWADTRRDVARVRIGPLVDLASAA